MTLMYPASPVHLLLDHSIKGHRARGGIWEVMPGNKKKRNKTNDEREKRQGTPNITPTHRIASHRRWDLIERMHLRTLGLARASIYD